LLLQKKDVFPGEIVNHVVVKLFATSYID